jgi:hypothetical protein
MLSDLFETEAAAGFFLRAAAAAPLWANASGALSETETVASAMM